MERYRTYLSESPMGTITRFQRVLQAQGLEPVQQDAPAVYLTVVIDKCTVNRYGEIIMPETDDEIDDLFARFANLVNIGEQEQRIDVALDLEDGSLMLGRGSVGARVTVSDSRLLTEFQAQFPVRRFSILGDTMVAEVIHLRTVILSFHETGEINDPLSGKVSSGSGTVVPHRATLRGKYDSSITDSAIMGPVGESSSASNEARTPLSPVAET
jgi:hypothetical protein